MLIGEKNKGGVRLGRKWERKGEGVKKTPEVIKGQKGLESIC